MVPDFVTIYRIVLKIAQRKTRGDVSSSFEVASYYFLRVLDWTRMDAFVPDLLFFCLHPGRNRRDRRFLNLVARMFDFVFDPFFVQFEI